MKDCRIGFLGDTKEVYRKCWGWASCYRRYN